MKALSLVLASIAGAGIMCSCSDNDTAEEPDRGKTISFGALVPGVTRSVATTTSTISSFQVYAFTAGKPYMENVTVSRNGATWSYSPVMYWPETPVNFYAYSPDISVSPSEEPSGLNTIVNYNNKGDTDFLYAVNVGQVAKSTPVMMNFRHAMSKVNVNLSSSNSMITVKVYHVSLLDVKHKGSFTFPSTSTTSGSQQGVGYWSNLNSPIDIITFYSISADEALTLTNTPVDVTEKNLEIDYMLPQPLDNVDFNGTEFTGNAIQIDCEIFDAASGSKIWPRQDTPDYLLVPHTPCGRLIYPLTTSNLTEWKIGCSYIYNIKIDNPNVLKPIDFNVTVDEFNIDNISQ